MSDTPPAPTTTTTTATTTATAPPKKRSRAGLVALLLLLLVPVGLCAPFCLGGGKADVADATILELDLEQPVAEAAAATSIFHFKPGLTTRDVVFALEQGAKDPRVKGLYARIGGQGHGLATAQEVRDAVLAFKQSGKPTLAFSESFGELSPGTGGYYVASAFDEIWLMPTGNVSLTGLAGEAVFARAAFDKAGVEPPFAARKEYKNAPNTFTEQSFTEAHKEATLRLLTTAQAEIARGIAAARPVVGDAAAVDALLAGGPYGDQQALEKKLVDKLGYRDEALAHIKEQAGAGAQLLWLAKYLERAGTPYDDDGTVVAVVTGVGQILRGKSNSDPLSGAATIGSDTVSQALREAIADDDVKAIVLRIDSPGGSVTASEAIAHEVLRASQGVNGKKKPVIASMGNVAGSGGYYIAMNADAIVAQPGTITGSIGVYAGKFVTSKLWEQLGINFETVAVGDRDTSFFSTDEPYSENARRKLDALVDDIYVSFVTKVAQGRKRTFEQIEPVAHGRIWSGSDGKDKGLVDALGGFPVALQLVREKLGLAKDAPLRIQDFPRRRTPVEELVAMVTSDEGDSSERPGQAYAATSKPGLPSARLLLQALAQEPAVLMTPDLRVLP
jgi:protease-4